MKSGGSYTTHKCPHCGKFHGGGSNPGGTGAADEGKEPGGSDSGVYDESTVPDGNDNDNAPQMSAKQEAAEIQKPPQGKTRSERARNAVRAKLRAVSKRDGKY